VILVARTVTAIANATVTVTALVAVAMDIVVHVTTGLALDLAHAPARNLDRHRGDTTIADAPIETPVRAALVRALALPPVLVLVRDLLTRVHVGDRMADTEIEHEVATIRGLESEAAVRVRATATAAVQVAVRALVTIARSNAARSTAKTMVMTARPQTLTIRMVLLLLMATAHRNVLLMTLRLMVMLLPPLLRLLLQ